MLALTGQRLREIANLRWDEIDMKARLIVIDGKRMKTGNPHTVPLAPMAYALLVSLPRFTGPCVFSSNAGKVPYQGFHHAKTRLDAACGVKDYTLHDLRRGFRSRLSALPIDEPCREAMIAHSPTGIKGVYNRHSYDVEKRRGFALYEAALQQVLDAEAFKLAAD